MSCSTWRGGKSSDLMQHTSSMVDEPWLLPEEKEEEDKKQLGAKLELIEEPEPEKVNGTFPIVAVPLTEVWPDHTETVEHPFVVDAPERLTKFGLNVDLAPRPYRVDVMDAEEDHVAMKTLLKAMNTAGREWSEVYEPEGTSAPRFYTHWPGPHKPVAFEDAHVKRLRFVHKLETSQLVSPAELYRAQGAQVSLLFDPSSIPAHTRAAFPEDRGLHCIPLRIDLLEASNTSAAAFKVAFHTPNLHTGGPSIKFAQARTIDNATTTVPSGTASYLPPTELGRMFEFGAASAFNHPEAQRWMYVDETKVLAHAETLRYNNGPNLLVFDFHDPLFPPSLVECILFSYGHVLRHASELCETERKEKLAGPDVTDASRLSDPIRLPYKRPVGRDDQKEAWVINYRAFEVALKYLCGCFRPSDIAWNMRAPSRVELEPRDKLGWHAFSRDVKPASISVTTEMVFVDLPFAPPLTEDQQRRLEKELRDHALSAATHTGLAKRVVRDQQAREQRMR